MPLHWQRETWPTFPFWVYCYMVAFSTKFMYILRALPTPRAALY